MKRKFDHDIKWTALFFGGFFIVLVIYLFGVGVRVDWHSRNISFATALSSIQWRTIIPDLLKDDYFYGISSAGFLMICSTLTSKRWMHFGVALVGFVFPIVCYGFVFVWIMLISPYIIFEIFSGHSNGEFFVESMPETAAIGLWMLLCLLSMIYQIYRYGYVPGKVNI